MSQYPQDKQQYHQQYEQSYPPNYQQQQHYQQQHDSQMPQQPSMAHTYQAPTGMSPEKAHAHDDVHAQKQASKTGSSWSFGLFDCFAPIETCLLGWCCPCYIFGKTYERNKTGEKDPSGFNGMCAGHCLALYCGCSPILQCITRQTEREKNGINGSMAEDFLTACFCGCCALVQEEKESIVRRTGMDPKTGAIYQPVPNMTYP